jgi:hypothetical protein
VRSTADEEDSSYTICRYPGPRRNLPVRIPLIGHWLHLTDRGYGLWDGLAVDNTAEASAAGALFSDAAGKVAVLAKTCRKRHDRIRRAGLCHLLGRKGTGGEGG